MINDDSLSAECPDTDPIGGEAFAQSSRLIPDLKVLYRRIRRARLTLRTLHQSVPALNIDFRSMADDIDDLSKSIEPCRQEIRLRNDDTELDGYLRQLLANLVEFGRRLQLDVVYVSVMDQLR